MGGELTVRGIYSRCCRAPTCMRCHFVSRRCRRQRLAATPSRRCSRPPAPKRTSLPPASSRFCGAGHSHAAILEVRFGATPALFALGLGDGEAPALRAAAVSALNRADIGLTAAAPAPVRAARA